MHARTVAETNENDEVTTHEEEHVKDAEVEEADGESKKRKGPGFRDRKVG